MPPEGRPGSLAYRAFGRFHRDARLILVTSLVSGAALGLYWIDFNLYLSSLGLSRRPPSGSWQRSRRWPPRWSGFPPAPRRTGLVAGRCSRPASASGSWRMIALLASEALP